MDRISERFDGRLTFGDPSPTIPPAIVTVRDALSSLAAGGIFIGALIAFNTLVLVINARLASLATAMALGATRRSVLGGVALEGAVLGAVGGLVAIPLGLALGDFLIGEFGASILAGSGVDIAMEIDPVVLAGAPGTGAVIGALATWFAARKPLARPLDLIGGTVDRVAVGRTPRWLGAAGVALVLLATVLARGVGSGAVPVKASQVALVWGAVGIALVAAALIPTVAARLLRLRERSDPAAARIIRAEVNRVPIRISMIVSTVGLAAGMAASFAGLADLAPGALLSSFDERLGERGQIASAQQPWDPRFGILADPSTWLTDVDASAVSVRTRSLLPSATEPRLVIGLEPTALAVSLHLDAANPSELAAALGAGDVALTSIAAQRLGASVGESVELPTITGPREFDVAAVVEVGLADDSTIGDWIVAGSDTASTWWAATPSVAASREPFATPELMGTFDRTGYERATRTGIGRYFEPFALTGWVYLVAAVVAVSNFLVLALATRRRERAVLAVIGADAGLDRRSILSQAVLQGLLAIDVFVVSVVAFTGWLALMSPAFYGFGLPFGVSIPALAVGAGVMLGGLSLATIRPWVAAAHTSMAPALRGE